MIHSNDIKRLLKLQYMVPRMNFINIQQWWKELGFRTAFQKPKELICESRLFQYLTSTDSGSLHHLIKLTSHFVYQTLQKREPKQLEEVTTRWHKIAGKSGRERTSGFCSRLVVFYDNTLTSYSGKKYTWAHPGPTVRNFLIFYAEKYDYYFLYNVFACTQW